MTEDRPASPKEGRIRAVVSNGTNRFHLASLAAALQSEGVLAAFITSGWPTDLPRILMRLLANRPRWKRFLDREEAIDRHLVRSSPLVEILNQGARLLRSRFHLGADVLDYAAHALYAFRAKAVLRQACPEVYHYRSCFGLSSVKGAKQMGAVTICDQSIAHPRVLDHLVRNVGQLPPRGGIEPRSQIDRWMDYDLRHADHVVVNSHFVRETCLLAGMDPGRVHVIYWGVDDKFANAIPAFDREQITQRKRDVLLFAGGWEERKGAWTMLDAMERLGSRCRIEIAGDIDERLLRDGRMRKFLQGNQVCRLGILSRSDLAKKMTESAVFVFPSLAEGSARVIFEAMACGCYVITTKNSGSIVQDGIHGRLISPGRADELANAVTETFAPNSRVSEIGFGNAQTVRHSYSQEKYARAVQDLYAKLCQVCVTSHAL